MTTSPTGAYRSYLVRLRQSTAQGGWHASAQCVQTGNLVLFGAVEHLCAFLQTEITGSSAAAESESPAVPADVSARANLHRRSERIGHGIGTQ